MATCTKNGAECVAPLCDKDHTEFSITAWEERSGHRPDSLRTEVCS